jgi:hypothetical protein
MTEGHHRFTEREPEVDARVQERRVRFEVPLRQLGFHNPDMAYVVEPGDFGVWIGPNAVDGLEGIFKVCG